MGEGHQPERLAPPNPSAIIPHHNGVGPPEETDRPTDWPTDCEKMGCTRYSVTLRVLEMVRPRSSGAYWSWASAPGQEKVPGVTDRTK